MTHTYAVLEVSQRTYNEIKEKFEEAGYQQAFHDDGPFDPTKPSLIDMHGVALQLEGGK